MESNVISMSSTGPNSFARQAAMSFDQSQQFQDVLTAAHEYLLNRVEEDHADLAAWSPATVLAFIRRETLAFVQQWRIPVNDQEMELLTKALVNEINGYGPLQVLLEDPSVEDILINGCDNVYVSRHGRLEKAGIRFSDDRHVLRIVRRILNPLGRRLDESSPMVDARLPDGGRLNAIIHPLAVDGPMVSIRKFRNDPFSPRELMEKGSFDYAIYALLKAAVEARCNVLISGGTSSGKTSLLNAMASFCPASDRIITVEDTAELALKHPHVVRLESRTGGFDGSGAIHIRDLMRNSLRMRPDRIVIGEVRGPEVLEMLQAMNTGHDGSMATIHANSPRDCLYRMEMLAGFAGFQGSEDSLRRQIASALDIIVQISRLGNGRRVITSITEVIGVSDTMISTQDIYQHETYLDLEQKEHSRWRSLGFHPHNPKLEPFRQYLREAMQQERF
ncbi:Flp pilus assembly protein, ATPase CpaF [Frateuria aurantia DSM 6220]|uniref:Flp pilus assembly protein, ATPase CpaF n=2 Tax=Frateuria aurantia TaxID=81475 RepID=H8L1F4_FRAAD|nr:Flp pilus assembly protein, ATPase CpaF [Frateuria aurantia DSM 6220]